MVELYRTVRFCLDAGGHAPPRHNTFSAWPPIRGLGRYYELHVTCHGRPDPDTGYLVNIKVIDHAVHDRALPVLQEALRDDAGGAAVPMGRLMRQLFDALAPAMPHPLTCVQLQLTPMVYLEVRPMPATSATPATPAPDTIVLAQQYEFSAAHRLHVPSLSDADNRATFGKCNNPAGHGHNYRVEVAIRLPVDAHGHLPAVEQLDALVDDAVIQKLDHKHLNVDVPAFATLNPSVEHIARVIHAWLADRVGELGATLEHIRVWETGKTACTYRGTTPLAT